MAKLMSEAEFAAKVEWEGGVFAALEYGLKATDCVPGAVRDGWAALEAVYLAPAFQKSIADVEEKLAEFDTN